MVNGLNRLFAGRRSAWGECWKTVLLAGQIAFLIARHASTADIRAYGINGATRMVPDGAAQCRAPVGVAAHAGTADIDQGLGNGTQFGVGLKRKARPRSVIGTTCPAGLTDRTVVAIDGFARLRDHAAYQV